METNDKIKGWDAFYIDKNAFGKPYPELVKILKGIVPKKSLLDLGAGQGRNAFLAKNIGFEVTAIDYSETGIKQILAEGINARVEDIFQFHFDKKYQVILLDAVIHCQPEDLEKEKVLFKNIENHIETEGVLLLLTHQWDMREDYLIDLFRNNYPTLQLLFNKHIEHHFYPPKSKEESIMELAFMCFEKQ